MISLIRDVCRQEVNPETAVEELILLAKQGAPAEELRKVLNSPDQNMRLAVFDQMVKSGDEAMKLIAYEAGLASADSVMRTMAFKAVLMSQDKLHLTLAVDRSAPKPIQEASEKYLAKNGSGHHDPAQGIGNGGGDGVGGKRR